MDEIYVVVEDFSGSADDDLSLPAGSRVTVIEGGEPGWWVVETEDGRQGIFPSNYLEPFSNYVPENDSPVETQPEPAIVSPRPITAGASSAVDELLAAKKKETSQKTDEEKLLATDEPDQQDEGKVKQMTAEEKRERYRNEVIAEIVNTEADYVKDLEIIVRVRWIFSVPSAHFSSFYWDIDRNQLFLHPIREKEIIPRPEISNLFSNVEAILSVNQELITNLVSHRSDPVFMVGAIFLKMVLDILMFFFSSSSSSSSRLLSLFSLDFHSFQWYTDWLDLDWIPENVHYLLFKSTGRFGCPRTIEKSDFWCIPWCNSLLFNWFFTLTVVILFRNEWKMKNVEDWRCSAF